MANFTFPKEVSDGWAGKRCAQCPLETEVAPAHHKVGVKIITPQLNEYLRLKSLGPTLNPPLLSALPSLPWQ